MILIINGEEREIEESTISELLAGKNLRAEMVVVEHNGVIIARADYAKTDLAPSDRLEIVQMMAGG